MEIENGRCGSAAALPGSAPSREGVSVLRTAAANPDDELREYRQTHLLTIMEDISEDCWCAGWMSGNEHSLWARVFEGADRKYGMFEVSEEQAATMRKLAEQTDTWWLWDDGRRRVTLDEFRAIRASVIEARRAETEHTGSVHESAVRP